ncbi:MAG: hypothetical protein HQK65_09995 [Desulfamplus sp.]|nr:hypothetical protein [Desulfamplus sp.]
MNIYIGIEIKIRELESRLLLALEAAERGHTVVLGCKTETVDLASTGVLKPGLVHDKSITPSGKNIGVFRGLKDNGCILTSQDEEHGLFHESYDKFASQRFSEKTLQFAEKVFCWGKHDIKPLQRIFPEFNEKFKLTGSPRVDLWRPEFNTSYLSIGKNHALSFKKKYGEYILMPSNFILVLNEIPLWYRIKSKRNRGYYKKTEYEYDDYYEVAWRVELLAKIIKFIRRLSTEYPDKKIVIRPHPLEAMDAWPDIIGQVDNVHITREGSINSWIINATHVMHNGCTSGFEASASNIPVLALRFIPSIFEQVIPNSVGFSAFTEDQAIEIVNKIITNKHMEKRSIFRPKEAEQILNFHFCNLKGKFAFEKIVDEWEEINQHHLYESNNWDAVVAFINRNKEDSIDTGIITQRANLFHKFPSIEKEELNNIILKYQKSLDRFFNLKLKRLGRRSFIINN